MKQDLQQMYRRAMDLRTPWTTRWDSALRYTFPRSDDDAATLFDATAADAADNLAASIYSLLTPPESLWISLVPESADSPDVYGGKSDWRGIRIFVHCYSYARHRYFE